MLNQHGYATVVLESTQNLPDIDGVKPINSDGDVCLMELNAADQHQAKPLYERMRQYKNDLLINKLQSDMKLSRADADELFEDVKRFIALCATTPQSLGLSRQIDQAWHTFILITKEYARFCNEYCGRYIHHEPSDPFNLGKDYVAERRKTFDLAKAVFTTLSSNWDENAAGCTHNCTNGD